MPGVSPENVVFVLVHTPPSQRPFEAPDKISFLIELQVVLDHAAVPAPSPERNVYFTVFHRRFRHFVLCVERVGIGLGGLAERPVVKYGAAERTVIGDGADYDRGGVQAELGLVFARVCSDDVPGCHGGGRRPDDCEHTRHHDDRKNALQHLHLVTSALVEVDTIVIIFLQIIRRDIAWQGQKTSIPT